MQSMATTKTNYVDCCVLNKEAEISSSLDINSGNISMDLSPSSQVHESEMEAKDNLDSLVANSIGRLICEAGLEPDFVHLPSFQGVIDLLTRGVRIAMPTYDYILQVQLREVQQHEMALKRLWERNGCTLMLERWKGQSGKDFIRALVRHNEGMLFLRSVDISTIFNDVDELTLVVCEMVDDIGVDNIVQIITNDASCYMQAVEHALLKKYNHSFSFALCADYCINLVLENVAALDHVKEVLMKASRITRFIYSNALPLELKKFYIPGGEIISNSHMEYVAMFITLDRLVSQRANLIKMFRSSEWTSSDLDSVDPDLSRQIREIIESENAFWIAADRVLKVTRPIISVLVKLEADNCSMGVLYDAMDNAKEEIKQNLGRDHARYWKLIDHIWDDYLHSPIHAAGYFLNPEIFYSDRFRHDAEISSGITTCILQVVKNHYDAKLVGHQLDLYQRKSGLFASDAAAQEAMEIPQDSWWLEYGADTKELQCFARRILSQPCFGASRYNIDHSLSERLHTEPRPYPDQERFRKMEYIHYNLRLRNAEPRLDGPEEGKHGKLITKLGDWISAEPTPRVLCADD